MTSLGSIIHYASLVVGIVGLPIDPDTLPAIDIRLVPPKVSYSRIRDHLALLHKSREKEEQHIAGLIPDAYAQAMKGRYAKLESIVRNFAPSASSFLQTNSSGTEELVVHIRDVPDVGASIIPVINDIEEKRRSEEQKTIDDLLKEFKQINIIINKFIENSFPKYFQKSPSFIQRPVLNIRIGNSDIENGSGHNSFPTVVDIVREEETVNRDLSENNLNNLILFYVNKLINENNKFLKILLIPNYSEIPQIVYLHPDGSLSPASFIDMGSAPIPAPLAGIVRRRAMKHSTVEVDITPPAMDETDAVDMLNSDLQSYQKLRRVRDRMFIQAKERMVKQEERVVDWIIREAASRIEHLDK
jgi:hypothetical protein